MSELEYLGEWEICQDDYGIDDYEHCPIYWQNGVKYCQEAEVKRSAPTLFDMELETA